MAAATDADWVTRLVLGWLAAKRSQHTRAAYARDIGITPQRRTSRAASWLAWCHAEGAHPVTGVTGFHVTQYARQLDAAGLSPASVARKLAAVSGWYAWLVQRGHITTSPAAGVERPKGTSATSGTPATPTLTRDQTLALLHAADAAQGPQCARAAALVAVLLFTGARVSEVIGADVEDLGTDHGRPVLWVTRPDGRRQALTLPGPAASRIKTYLASRAGPAATPGKSGTGPRRVLFATRTGRRLFAADVGQILRRLAAQAALPADLSGHVGPDAMRHTFAALYLEAGGSPRDLQAAMGHSDARTTRRYDRAGHTPRRPPGHMIAAYLEAPA